MKKNIWMILAGLFAGALVGLGASLVCRIFLKSACPLTQDPVTSTLLGAMVGSVIAVLGLARAGR